MESHQYYEPNKYYEDFIAVYSRVSTAQQNIQKQILLAESYIHNNRIDLDKVIWLKDDNVSANKLAMEERSGLQKTPNANTAEKSKDCHRLQSRSFSSKLL